MDVTMVQTRAVIYVYIGDNDKFTISMQTQGPIEGEVRCFHRSMSTLAYDIGLQSWIVYDTIYDPPRRQLEELRDIGFVPETVRDEVSLLEYTQRLDRADRQPQFGDPAIARAVRNNSWVNHVAEIGQSNQELST